MKNIDFKKLLVFIVIIAVAILVIFGTTKIFKGIGKPSKSVQEKIENQIMDYFSLATIGRSSVYSGIDLLYDKDEVKVEDLDKGSLIELAILYAEKNEKEIIADNDAAANLSKMIKTDATGYKGEELRNIVKELFDVELPKESIIAGVDYLYNYYYAEEQDTYIKTNADTYDLSSDGSSMDFYVVETRKKGKNFVSEVAVAYVYNTGSSYAYAKDKNGTTIVEQDLKDKEFPKKKVNEFNKYEFTTKKVNGNYVLVSVKKVK